MYSPTPLNSSASTNSNRLVDYSVYVEDLEKKESIGNVIHSKYILTINN